MFHVAINTATGSGIPKHLPHLPHVRFLTLITASFNWAPSSVLTTIGDLPVYMPNIEVVDVRICGSVARHSVRGPHADAALTGFSRLREVRIAVPPNSTIFESDARQKLPLANAAGLLTFYTLDYSEIDDVMATFSS
jgi:hypothetical protein